MTRFADTFYFLALLNPKDKAHSSALAHSVGPGRIVTSEWVLTELADALASRDRREVFVGLHRLLRSDPGADIVPADTALFARGVAHFAERPDKDWSLTDCISFIIMRDLGVEAALTGDHHFEQAGFQVLLK